MAARVHTLPAPIMEINTTPLIDVMLVLLVMMILTVPVATHQTLVTVPTSQPTAAMNGNSNTLALTSEGSILWNGTPQTEGQVIALLQATKALPVEPELRFAPDGEADYALANRLMKDIRQSKISHFGFIGNERFARFDAP